MLNSEEIALLKEVARRSFREIADHDYLSARLSFKYQLFIQFYWQGLQAVEKYLKAILLYQQKPAKITNHKLTEIYECVRNEVPDAKIQLSEDNLQFLDELEFLGNNRYFDKPIHINAHTIHRLDNLIWKIRRWCTQVELLPKLWHETSTWCLSSGSLELYVKYAEDSDIRKAFLDGNASFGSYTIPEGTSGSWGYIATPTLYSQAGSIHFLENYIYVQKDIKASLKEM